MRNTENIEHAGERTDNGLHHRWTGILPFNQLSGHSISPSSSYKALSSTASFSKPCLRVLRRLKKLNVNKEAKIKVHKFRSKTARTSSIAQDTVPLQGGPSSDEMARREESTSRSNVKCQGSLSSDLWDAEELSLPSGGTLLNQSLSELMQTLVQEQKRKIDSEATEHHQRSGFLNELRDQVKHGNHFPPTSPADNIVEHPQRVVQRPTTYDGSCSEVSSQFL